MLGEIRRGVAATAVVGTLVIGGCASDNPAYIGINRTKELRSLPLEIVYTDSATPIALYLSMPAPPPLPETDVTSSAGGCDSSNGTSVNPAFGALGAAAGALTGSLILSHYMNKAQARLEPYLSDIAKAHISDEEYEAAKSGIATVPWLAAVSFQRRTDGDVGRAIADYMRGPGDRAIIVLSPCAAMRDDMNRIVVTFNMHIYRKDPYGYPGAYTVMTNEVLGSAWTSGKDKGYPVIDYQESDQDLVMDKSVVQFFSDGGVRFKQGFDAALASASGRIEYYFNGR